MRVLLTGASGELGRALKPLLKKCEVEALPRPLPKPGTVKNADVVLHLAGLRYDRRGGIDDFRAANAGFTTDLLSWLELSGMKPHLIFFSTMYVYGENSDSPLSEKAEPNPHTPYGITKLEAERLIAHTCPRLGIPYTILRLATVYGAGGRDVLEQLREIYARLVPFVIGDGRQRRSLLSLQNLAAAVLIAAADPRWRGLTVNVADPEPRQMLELAKSLGGGRTVRKLPNGMKLLDGRLRRLGESFVLDTQKLIALEKL